MHQGGVSLGGVGVTDLTRILDVWFDNFFFSDISVQSRLKTADQRLDRSGEALTVARRALRERHDEVMDRIRTDGDA